MNSQAGESNSGAAVRGLLLVLVAVVIGVLLLRSVDDPDAEVVSATSPDAVPGDTLPAVTQPPATTAAPGTGDDNTVSTVVVATTQPAATDSTAAEPFQPRPAAEVSVQVANSTTVSGAAGRTTDRFKTLSYVTKTPINYKENERLERTRIYYQPGSLLEARAIAGVLELDGDNDVFPMPDDTSDIPSFETPDVLVVLGTDLAE